MESNEKNKLTNKVETGMDAWNRLAAVRSGGWEGWMKEGEGIEQKNMSITRRHRRQCDDGRGDGDKREGKRLAWGDGHMRPCAGGVNSHSFKEISK